MDYVLEFGKKRKVQTNKKLSKKLLNTCTLKCLQKVAKKYKISIYKKGTKKPLKKTSLITKLKKSKSINKILKTAYNMKHKKMPKRRSSPKRKSSKFGKSNPQPGTPSLTGPIELFNGMTYDGYKQHYLNTPPGFIAYNLQGPLSAAPNVKGASKPSNFYYNQRLLGLNSLPPYGPTNESIKKTKFGQYFR